MGFPFVLAGLSVLPQVPAVLRGFTNTASAVGDAFKKGGLGGAIGEYTSGDAAKAYYSGMMTGGDGITAPLPGAKKIVGGQTKYWDPVNGYQLLKTKGTSTREAPIKYTDKGAPMDPNTGQTRTGNIVNPALLLEPDDQDQVTVAAVSQPVVEETVDTSKAIEAARLAAGYQKAKKEDDQLYDIHKGYKTMREFGGEPVVTQAYMEQDAMREWAKANPTLAQKLIDKHGLSGEGIFGKEPEGGTMYSPTTPLGPITPAPIMTATANFSPVSNSTFSTNSNINIENLGNMAGLNPQPVQSGFFKAGNVATSAMPMVNALSNAVSMDPDGRYSEVFKKLKNG